MKISEAIKALQYLQDTYGDIECELEEPGENGLHLYPDFTIAADQHEDGMHCHIRSFLY